MKKFKTDKMRITDVGRLLKFACPECGAVVTGTRIGGDTFIVHMYIEHDYPMSITRSKVKELIDLNESLFKEKQTAIRDYIPTRANVTPELETRSDSSLTWRDEIDNRDYWIKVFGMLDQNWALIASGNCRIKIYFLDDLGRIFDNLEFDSEEEATVALRRNGFVRCSEELADSIGTPDEPFSILQGRETYSSGEFWE